MRRLLPAVLVAGLLAACDAGPKAPPPPPAAEAVAPAPAAAPASVAVDPRDVPAPRLAGRPIWSANRQYTAEENARRHFEKDGAAFGARTLDEFVAKVHAFTGSPPKGVLTIKRRNGDRLLYDPKSNTFAVVTRAGAPRTMFKPDDGRAYWERQVRIEQEKSADH